ncbi:MAG: hypothetical protein EOP84_22715 [Verrucomicrobiaceae bacterium]|nr:MAG: hypothetical protein EOP84_22715 [Verrucomicrobiaceae bacterium]
MKPTGKRGFRRVLPLVAAVALVTQAGCGKGNIKFNSSSEVRKEWKSNSRWTISHSKNDVTRKLETSDDVEIQNGKFTRFPGGAVVKVEETGSPDARVAELREKDGTMELWIKEGADFRKGLPEDEAWLDRCLTDLTGPSDRKRMVKATLQDPLAPAHTILTALEDTQFSSERAKILKDLAARPGLSAAEQAEVAGAAAKLLSFSSEKKAVLLALVRRPDFPPEAKQAVLRAIDQLSFDSEKIEVQRALLEKLEK